MRKTLKSEILGLVDIKNSYVELKLSDLFIGNKKYMNVSAKVKISPNKELEAAHSLEIFTVKLYLDDEVIFRENVQVDLAEETEKIFEKDIEMINSQSEDRMFKLEIDDIRNGKIDYTSVSELVSVEPVKDSKVYIKFDYYKRGLTHNFSFYSNTKSKIYLKMNNNNWKEIKEGFMIEDADLEGKINYFQLYTTDEENTRIYSNIVRVIKSQSSE